MEYTFRQSLFSQAEAKVSMEQAAFGLWLSDDMAENLSLTQDLLLKTKAILQEHAAPYIFHSANFHLSIDHNSVELMANTSDEEFIEQEQDLFLSDENLTAHCGIEDFYELMCAWEDYLQK